MQRNRSRVWLWSVLWVSSFVLPACDILPGICNHVNHSPLVTDTTYSLRSLCSLYSPDSPFKSQKIRTADGMSMVYVLAGEFWMGSPEGEGFKQEHPQHLVTLDAYWIDQHEVTNAQYRRCVQAGKCAAPGSWDREAFDDPDQPVSGVSWFDAVAYCDWADARLPTEAEWERAARGEEGGRYAWGDSEPDCTKAQYLPCSDHKPGPVGELPAGLSPYGLMDVAGNVWEWTADWYQSDYYAHSLSINPRGPDTGEYRSARGGSCISNADHLRAAFRYRFSPQLESDSKYAVYVGFRCAQKLRYYSSIHLFNKNGYGLLAAP